MQSVPSSPLLMAIVAVGAVLLLVLFLKSRSSVTSEVRLKPAATQAPRSVRARGTILRRKSPGFPARFEGMEVAEFEARVSGLLRELGYAVRPAPLSGLHDVDLLLEATNRRVAVQLKRWKAPVGERSVYALFTGRIHYATDEAWLITTSEFTRKAIKLAETTGVRLVDGVELAEWLAGREEPFPAQPEIDPESPARPSRSSLGPSEGPGDAVVGASVQESTDGTQETPLGRA
ncbi:MAG TPA: restriction endonuclease [Rubrobacteraceae bacterium]|nr:restriction endonuclease [Rubrobacteraceae bacterium]